MKYSFNIKLTLMLVVQSDPKNSVYSLRFNNNEKLLNLFIR